MVPTRKAVLFTKAMNNRNRILLMDTLRTKQRAELKRATVAIKENVVQAVLQFLSAETLYKNLCAPIRINDRMAKLYQFTVDSS